jgi:hypothetical protein
MWNLRKNSLQIALDTVLGRFHSTIPIPIPINLYITFRALLKRTFPNIHSTIPRHLPFKPSKINFIFNNFQSRFYLPIKNIRPTPQKPIHIFISSHQRISNTPTPQPLPILQPLPITVFSDFLRKLPFNTRIDTIIPVNLEIVNDWA